MKFIINTRKEHYIADRFGRQSPCIKVAEPLVLYSTNNTSIIIMKKGATTWEQEYNGCITDATSLLNTCFATASSMWVWTINGIKTYNGAFAIIPGRLFSISTSSPSSLTISKPYLTCILSLQEQYKIMHRFIMCIYHYLNNLHRRLMNPEAPYGIVQRYLSAQACWNLNMFSTNFIADSFAAVDSVNIILGYTNSSCDLVDVHFSVNITADGNGLGLLGIYLDSTSTLYDPNSHSIQRNFITTDGIDHGFADITNPNDCIWERGGKWTEAKISQDFHNIDKQIKCTYIITRNPYVTGYIRYSKESLCTFNIIITATTTRPGEHVVLNERSYEFNVSCASLIQGRNPEYIIEENA